MGEGSIPPSPSFFANGDGGWLAHLLLASFCFVLFCFFNGKINDTTWETFFVVDVCDEHMLYRMPTCVWGNGQVGLEFLIFQTVLTVHVPKTCLKMYLRNSDHFLILMNSIFFIQLMWSWAAFILHVLYNKYCLWPWVWLLMLLKCTLWVFIQSLNRRRERYEREWTRTWKLYFTRIVV